MVTVPPTPLFTTVIVVFAVVFGILWTAVNFYHLYPYVQYFLVARLFGADSDPYTRLPEGHEFVSPPTFDVLLPAYEEGNVIHQAISSIRSADYPQHRIRINVLVEPEDADTRDALATLAEEYRFDEVPIPSEYEEVVVPEKYPGMPNKPRALNFGFDSTDGDIVGVIDAEDIVDPDLFSTVAYALVDQGNDYVQGKLDMVNEYDGWKNLVFRAEYAFWFRLLVPSFHFVGYPVPLGGTTNFFRRETLERASDLRLEQYGTPWSDRQQAWLSRNGFPGSVPWDPRNVTEDFELGILLWKEGFDMTLIDVVTRKSHRSPRTRGSGNGHAGRRGSSTRSSSISNIPRQVSAGGFTASSSRSSLISPRSTSSGSSS
ncbi:glycosyltransferase [Halobaculum litoreum]|uniref:Glycosyltransferase n=1 Tax=Halobaculum litoreum TaxID=3031998 RepID=A0ABD5XXJ5_9EURY